MTMENNNVSSNIAHVARQRQESRAAVLEEARAACIEMASDSNGDYREACHSCAAAVQQLKYEAPTPSAAVAEGVDTADFRRLSYTYADALMHKSVPATNDAWRALIAHIETVYGAQQRQAGRREEREIGYAVAASALAWKERAEKAEAALARQPVSEGLRTLPQYARVREEFEIAVKMTASGTHFDVDSAMLVVDALLSAVPPAKAEGMSDETAKLAAMRAAFHVNMLRAYPGKTHDEISAEIDRAILAQQPKGAKP